MRSCGGLKMKNQVILKHHNHLKSSREFFLMKVPEELDVFFYSIVFFVVVALMIVVFGKIDDVVKVRGIVRTKENVSSVKNVIAGKITEMSYEPGQKVCKGDELFKIDSTIFEAQKENLLAVKKDLINKLEVVELLIQSFELEKNVIPHEEILAFTRFDSYLKSLNELKMNALIARKLYQDEMENPKAMQSKKNMEMREIEFRLAETSVEKIRADFIRDLYLEKNQLDLEILKTEKELTALENQYDFLVVRAPVDGFVQEVSSLNVGDYLSGNSVVLNIVPNDLKNFRVEIQIPPKDIGKIKVGLKVKYRLSAFPFFEYKGAEGVVTSIDPDIRGSESGNLFYSVYADIDRIEFENNRGEKFPIKAGLETDTRIVLETRNILYFVLKRMDFLC